MTLNELRAALAAAGCTMGINPTGNPEWRRLFIRWGSVAVGRASIKGEDVYCLHWYTKSNEVVTVNDFVKYNVAYYLKHKTLITAEQWEACVRQAVKNAHDLRAEKKARREANPHPQGKRRRALAPINPHRYLMQLLEVYNSGVYYDHQGMMFNTDGTRSIFCDVDK